MLDSPEPLLEDLEDVVAPVPGSVSTVDELANITTEGAPLSTEPEVVEPMKPKLAEPVEPMHEPVGHDTQS
ncbi:hypothetical protein KY284_005313 [Solanum tuberosum]|nr:hypothetical protein KY284_005313 [Solanum tuberosum]